MLSATVPLLESLERAARRGVRVQVVVDGVGTPALPAPWTQRLSDAGVALRVGPTLRPVLQDIKRNLRAKRYATTNDLS